NSSAVGRRDVDRSVGIVGAVIGAGLVGDGAAGSRRGAVALHNQVAGRSGVVEIDAGSSASARRDTLKGEVARTNRRVRDVPRRAGGRRGGVAEAGDS